MTTDQADPAPGAPNLVLPARPARAFAIYAFRSARTTGPGGPSALPSALAARGIGVRARHLLTADEPVSVDGAGRRSGPDGPRRTRGAAVCSGL